jgi:hypothetical protein
VGLGCEVAAGVALAQRPHGYTAAGEERDSDKERDGAKHEWDDPVCRSGLGRLSAWRHLSGSGIHGLGLSE